ncbi:hypothetical protein [Burkholderia puraquae]|uniref:hypothetical protein n=1 Tax=Burkholderia puraquae TaxID=1904757 RepID=UPI001FCABF8E|nr:hypothetical protein [Burkholderia puraquae]
MTLQARLKGTRNCVGALSASDFRMNLGRFDVPTRGIHGDDDPTHSEPRTRQCKRRAPGCPCQSMREKNEIRIGACFFMNKRFTGESPRPVSRLDDTVSCRVERARGARISTIQKICSFNSNHSNQYARQMP